jgi:amino-acid N-acetyltransferase
MHIQAQMIQDQLALEKLQKFLQINKLPIEDIQDYYAIKGRMFLGYYDELGELVGSGGLELHGDAALLRSVAVKETARGSSLGHRIVTDLISQAKKSNSKHIFLLTETAQSYFERFGFKEINRNEVPDPIRASSEFTHVCPTSAICMFYKL